MYAPGIVCVHNRMGCGSSTVVKDSTIVEDSALLARHLSSILDLREENQTIKAYVSALTDAGYDNPKDFDGLTLLELEGDFVFKKGHVKKVRHLAVSWICHVMLCWGRCILLSCLFPFLG